MVDAEGCVVLVPACMQHRQLNILLRLSRSRCTAITVHVINYWVSHTLITAFALIHMLAPGSRRQHQLQKYKIRQYMSGWGQTSAVPPSQLLVMSHVTCQMYSGCFYTNIKLCPFCPQLADPTISCSLIDRNLIGLQFGVSNLITNLIGTAQSARVRVLSGRVRRQEELLQRFPGEFSLVSSTPDPQSALALCTHKQTHSSFPTHLPEKLTQNTFWIKAMRRHLWTRIPTIRQEWDLKLIGKPYKCQYVLSNPGVCR